MVKHSNQSISKAKEKARKQRKPKAKPLTRSENMSRIRGKNTRPEILLRHSLWNRGLRYRLHDKNLPGSPDLVFSKARTVIFVHGCFWHCHSGCNNFRIPKTRTEWWQNKLSRNRDRDTESQEKLKAAGWRVIVIWECEIGNETYVSKIIEEIRESGDYKKRKITRSLQSQ